MGYISFIISAYVHTIYGKPENNTQNNISLTVH